ncbi:MAG: LPS-assembly protein LptD [Tannerellaceae bacterium]|nr:LPS-assembly protein LptD [Tannerellaceae bacterium]
MAAALILFLLLVCVPVCGQESSPAPPKKANALEAQVSYQAEDSIVMTTGNNAYLYGQGKVNYQDIELQSEYIRINMDSSLVYATFALDSAGEAFGHPIFKQGAEEYESKAMRYNFKTRKGYSNGSITQQGEGYVTANHTKKMADNNLNMMDGRYTTCDEHDHPHFYIALTKAKVRPHKDIVSGPVYLVIEDVPLPLWLPFAFFPFSSEYSSGIIVPSYGDESQRGFNLRDGGYYFAISDYLDLALTGEIYSKGSWGVSARSSYRKRYKFSGNVNASYLVTRTGDKGLPDYSLGKDFKIQWTHTQDAKADPFRSFSASINYSTSSFDRNNLGSYYPSGSGYADATQSNKGSSVNFTQRFPNLPLSLSGTMNINQRSRDSAIAVTLPDITVTLNRIYPLKRKNKVGKDRWYEKISMNYTGYLRNSIDTKENLLFRSHLIRDWRNAMQHTIPVSATFNVLQYINLTASANYKERWYTSRIDETFDPERQRVVPADTTYGFYRIYDFSGSLSASTTIYGDYLFLPALQRLLHLKQIRHRLEPSVSFSATPDFGSAAYGYYSTLHYTRSDGESVDYVYSPFRHNQFGVPGRGRSGSLNFSINNNVEAKILTDSDSTGERKISLIDKLSAGMSYNMAADSFRWSDMSVALRLKFSKSYSLNLNGMFDTYTYRLVGEGTSRRLERRNVPRWQAGKGFGRLISTGTSFSYTFNNETFKKWFGSEEASSSSPPAAGDIDGVSSPPLDSLSESAPSGRLLGAKKEKAETDADGYFVAKVPWSLSFSYSMRLGYDRQKIDFERLEYKYAITHSLSFNGNIQPTKNWNFNFNATYDFDTHRISYMTCSLTRNLHCFRMSGNFVPIGPYKSYSFSIAVNSSLLQDLKYDQSSNYRDAQKWY